MPLSILIDNELCPIYSPLKLVNLLNTTFQKLNLRSFHSQTYSLVRFPPVDFLTNVLVLAALPPPLLPSGIPLLACLPHSNMY